MREFKSRNPKTKRYTTQSLIDFFKSKYPVFTPSDCVTRTEEFILHHQQNGTFRSTSKETIRERYCGRSLPKYIYLTEIEEKISPSILWCPELSFMTHVQLRSEEQKKNVLRLNEFLRTSKNLLAIAAGVRERSLQIFEDEKALDKLLSTDSFKTHFKREVLNLIFIPIPFAMLSFGDCPNRTMIIIENLDTFYAFCQANRALSPPKYYYIVYGEGLKIKERYLWLKELNPLPTYIDYFGDIDYEGLEIPNFLLDTVPRILPDCTFTLAMPFYIKLMDQKSNATSELRVDVSNFTIMKQFAEQNAEIIKKTITQNQKTPQENLQKDEIENLLKKYVALSDLKGIERIG